MDIDTKRYPISFGPIMYEKLLPGDTSWSTFNASFEAMALTQAEIVGMIYEGRCFTTIHSNHWRTTANFVMGSHLAIDYDTCDARSSMVVLAKDPFVAKYASVLYTTISHTEDKPRSRILFMLESPIHKAEDYTFAASALLWFFSNADRQCRDAVRYFYGCRPGTGQVQWLAHELPLTVIRDMVEKYKQTGAREKKKVSIGYPQVPTDKEDILRALRYVNPWDIDYNQWLSILMAIHSEMPGDNGLQIAEAWADGKGNEVSVKWRSFKTNGNSTGKIGIGTLFAIAKEHGWSS